jgi:excisionase family DNA binding protein
MIELLGGRRAYTAAELAEANGLRPQQVAIALAALGVIGHVTRAFDARRGLVVWSGARVDRRSSVASALRTQYTVAEAAAVTGRSEKALRRRIDRRTLGVTRSGRWVLIPHSALQQAGLVDNRMKSTRTTHAAQMIVQHLQRQPRKALSAWQLSTHGDLDRQATEIILAALSAVGLVEREVAGGVVWRWRSD